MGMTEQKEDMILLWALSALGGAMVLIGLYCANYLAFECIRIRGESVWALVGYLSIFLALIGVSLLLMRSITKMYMSVHIEHCKKMFSGAGDVFACLVTFVSAFALVHLVNILGGWASWGMRVLSSGEVVIFSLLLATIVYLSRFVSVRLSKKGCKR